MHRASSLKQTELAAALGRDKPTVMEGVFAAASSENRPTSNLTKEEEKIQRVAVPSGLSASFIARAAVPRTLMGGTASMRAAGHDLLPPHPQEHPQQYRTRLQKTFLFNGFERALQMLVGKPFGPGSGVQLGEDVPPIITEWSEDIDLEGRTLNTFAEDLLTESMITGMTLVMPDLPMVPEGLTLFEERQVLGIRPYLTMIPGDRILGWTAERIMGHKVLTSIRWREEKWVVDDPVNDPFTTRLRRRVRVLFMGNPRELNPEADDYYAHWVIYEFDHEDEKWKLTNESGRLVPWRNIPVITHYTARVQFMHGFPPMDDLGSKNVEHWQSGSEQRNNLMVGRLPILHGSGFTPSEKEAKKVVGAYVGLFTEQPDSKLGYVTGAGDALAAGEADLERLRDEMAILSLQPLLERAPSSETATGKLIDTTIGDSRLQAWTRGLEQVLAHALSMMSVYAGFDGNAGTVSIETEFGIGPRDTADLKEIIQLRQLREISRATFFEMLVERMVLPEDFNGDEEIKRLEEEADSVAGEDTEDETEDPESDETDDGTGEESEE